MQKFLTDQYSTVNQALSATQAQLGEWKDKIAAEALALEAEFATGFVQPASSREPSPLVVHYHLRKRNCIVFLSRRITLRQDHPTPLPWSSPVPSKE